MSDLNQLEIDRRRKLAEMLLNRQQPTQGQMAGRFYVPSSPWQGVSNLANTYVGYKALKEADEDENSLTKQKQQALANVLSKAQESDDPSSVLMSNPDTMKYGVDLFIKRKSEEGKYKDPNQPFMVENGKIVPNQAYQDYQKSLKEGDKGFTLGPDQVRYDATGKVIAGSRQIPVSSGEDPLAPWKGIVDTKKRDEAKTRFGLAADKELQNEQENVDKAIGMNQALSRFIELNQSNITGAGYTVPGSQFVASAVNPDFSEMKSITDKLTPAMRQGMPGAASDRDVFMFRGATVGVDKQKEANENIASGLMAANQNMIDRFQFLNDYVADRGHTRGAQAEWKKYLEANPIFKKDSKTYELNPNRKSYQDWKLNPENEKGNSDQEYERLKKKHLGL